MILNKEVISPKVLENFVPLLDEVGEDFVARVHKKISRSGQNKWTTDLSQELFKYALECKTDFYLLIYKLHLSVIYFTHYVEQSPFFLTYRLSLSHVYSVLHSGELSAVWGASGFDAGLH